jgi:UDP-N-acetylglucosamine--dolichyl-phosphate N-acetylglucosaminephosphotransferase
LKVCTGNNTYEKCDYKDMVHIIFKNSSIINFIYSVPQLFYFIPCTRHRLPKYNPETDLLECSNTQFREENSNVFGKFCIFIFKTLRLIKWEKNEADGVITANNFTIINLGIIMAGPIHEKRLNNLLICVQLLCSVIYSLYNLLSFGHILL